MYRNIEMTPRLVDLIAIGFLVFLSLLFNVVFVDFTVPPFEDAAMLMRYARHFGMGQGIVWNIGEPPLDGATDFLFMIIVGLSTTIFSLEAATRGIVLVSHFFTIVFLYVGMRRMHHSGIVVAALTALYFALGPGAFLSAAYFGTSFFVMVVCIEWIVALTLMRSLSSLRVIIWFSVLGVILGLSRPEGVLVAFFMLFAIMLKHRLQSCRRLLMVFGAIFFIVGGAYFTWRWHYFGHPLPNPFYVKGGGISMRRIEPSIANTAALCFPFLPFYLLGLRSKALRMEMAIYAVPIIGMTLMWILVSDEMNIGARFQYPTLPIVLLSWYPFVKDLIAERFVPAMIQLDIKTKVAVALFVGVIVLEVLGVRASMSGEFSYSQDGRYDVAKILRKYAGHRYTIATSEAGLLPLYSEWRAIDTWGLNDAFIAHNGNISLKYLRKQRPDIVVWHSRFSPMTEIKAFGTQNRWFKMVMKMKRYVDKYGYILMASFGPTPHDVHYYYCSPNLPERNEIIRQIRSLKYRWYKDSQDAVDYSRFTETRVD